MSKVHDKVTEDSVNMIERLREARAEVETYKYAVEKELAHHVRQGENYLADQCAAWSSYLFACKALNSLRDLYEV